MRALPFLKGNELWKYFEMLPEHSALKLLFKKNVLCGRRRKIGPAESFKRRSWRPGSIDVNIMTKLDRVNFSKDDEALPPEFNDALAALRGFAMSDLAVLHRALGRHEPAPLRVP